MTEDIPTCLKEFGAGPDRLLAGSTGEMEMVAVIVIDLMSLKWLSENLISVTDEAVWFSSREFA